MLYLQAAMQQGISVDLIGLRVQMGRAASGLSTRDLMSFSAMLDRYAQLEKPIALTAVGCPSGLLPPRPGGTLAILAGQPEADVVVAWHAGFDGMDSFGGIHRALRRPPPPVRFRMERIPRHQLPSADQLGPWLDDLWVDTDQRIDQLHNEAT